MNVRFGFLFVYGNEIDSDAPTSYSVQLGNEFHFNSISMCGELNIRFKNIPSY